MTTTCRALFIAAPLALALAAGVVHAQGTARSMDIDLCVRSAGMGGASNAVFWGDTPNDWANPALLGYRNGIRYEWASTQLVPDLSSRVFLTTRRLVLGYGGIGFVNAGRPLENVGGTTLDYGSTVAIDPSGNPVGVFTSYEKIRAWGAGASLSRGVGALIGDAALPALLRIVDVAAGYNEKHVEMVIGAPAASTVGQDVGVLARVSFPGIPIQAAYGYSILNANDARVNFGAVVAPTSRIYRNGAAARVLSEIPGIPKSMLWGLLDASMSFGVAYDREKVQAGDDATNAYHVNRIGFEFNALRAISLRAGHVEDQAGNIVDMTFGVGIGLEWRGVIGARYDYASYPEAAGLSNVNRHAASAFFDPLAMLSGRH